MYYLKNVVLSKKEKYCALYYIYFYTAIYHLQLLSYWFSYTP